MGEVNALGLVAYLVVAVGLMIYHGEECNYPAGRAVSVGLLWPLLPARNVACEAARIVRGD